MYDCPLCGKKDSSDGEHFCWKCEQKYHEEQEQYKEEEKKAIRIKIESCACRGDEPCFNCVIRYSRLLSLDGKHEQAEAMLNR